MFKAITIVAALLTGAQAAGTGLRHQSKIVTMGHVAPAIAALAPLEAKEAKVVTAGTEASFVETQVGCKWNDVKCKARRKEKDRRRDAHFAAIKQKNKAIAKAAAARNAEYEKFAASKRKTWSWFNNHVRLH